MPREHSPSLPMRATSPLVPSRCPSTVSWGSEEDSPSSQLINQHPTWTARQRLRPLATTKAFLRTLLRRLFWLDPLPPRPISSPEVTPTIAPASAPNLSPIEASRQTYKLGAPTQDAITITSFDKSSDPLLTPRTRSDSN